jgi:NADPH:quinone reductase-like Zn-dependent oxidoreductase
MTRELFASAFSEYGDAGVLRWQELPDPEPGPGEVTIAVAACGLNHLDLDSREGVSPWQFEFPHVLGGEFAGTIAALGPGVEGWALGDPVTCEHQYACGECAECLRWRGDLCPAYDYIGSDSWGGYAELVRVPARLLIALDSPDQARIAASSLCAVSTAWSMVSRLAEIRPRETVLVPSASGGVAGALVQCARLAGARVIASVGSAAKAERVRALGADEVFVHAEVDPSHAVAELTGGRGVDAVLDTTAGPLLGEHLACLRRDGRLAFCGAHAGEKVEVDMLGVFVRGLRILGFRIATPEEIRTALGLALDGSVRVPIDREFHLSEAAAAHEYLERREHVGKVLLRS